LNCFKVETGVLSNIPRDRVLFEAVAAMCERYWKRDQPKLPSDRNFCKLLALQASPGVGKSFALYVITCLDRLDNERLKDLAQKYDRQNKHSEHLEYFHHLANSVGINVTYNFGLTPPEGLEDENNYGEFLGWRLLFSFVSIIIIMHIIHRLVSFRNKRKDVKIHGLTMTIGFLFVSKRLQ